MVKTIVYQGIYRYIKDFEKLAGRDFKSVASAFPPSRLIDYFSVFLIFLLQVNFLLLNYYTTL